MNLHGQIMNLPTKPAGWWNDNEIRLYKEGHRDARHAAAELALQADALNAELFGVVCWWLQALTGERHYATQDELRQIIAKARAAIAKATGVRT